MPNSLDIAKEADVVRAEWGEMQSRMWSQPPSFWRTPRDERVLARLMGNSSYNQRPSAIGDVIWSLLRRALFYGPLADDQFGDLSGLHKIDREILAAALTAARGRFSSIFVLWPNASNFEAESIAEMVAGLAGNCRGADCARVSLPEDPRSVAKTFISENCRPHFNQEYIGVGLKLPRLPEAFPTLTELAHMFLLLRGFLGKRLIYITRDTTILWRMWRTQYDGYSTTRADELRILARLKTDINNSLTRIKDQLSTGWMIPEGYFKEMMIRREREVFDLAIDAEVFGLCLDDVLHSACSITQKQVDILMDWVQSSTAASIVYYGPRGNDINIVRGL